MPIAARPSSPARSTISAGCEAPRRKEKVGAEASRAYWVMAFSREEAMHEPTRQMRVAILHAFAIKPEAMAHLVFDHVIIAGEIGRAVAIFPPFAGNAFRA